MKQLFSSYTPAVFNVLERRQQVTEVLLARAVDQFVRPSTGLSVGDTIALQLFAGAPLPLETSTMTLRVHSFVRQPLCDCFGRSSPTTTNRRHLIENADDDQFQLVGELISS